MSFTEADDSTIFTPATPPESVAGGFYDDDKYTTKSTPTPLPGHTYMIRSLASGEVITLKDGNIVLAQPDGRASHWVCEDEGGWLGFRNGVSGRFLGRDGDWNLSCFATWHKEWEMFRVCARTPRGSVLFIQSWYWFKLILRPVGMKVENETRKLAMIENGEPDEALWEFVEV
ncbi:uncharacterized protein K452DRAFT_293316 [Aplosporella prunicola CBS 121167]|uniref:Uncharacterized protein n=1 Tax=Aplosporella prunicola CBS 121167 TaxID=1176127 RepID=A0A6A6AVV6_9PEZI|nr:uncharacterized protein K452DRAFT_293316 [Aplosporella prunicola CBS 121167]KAF2135323.1 hypothetical protein K452DRAFT_293316 [Aplosporella prunicola CBS 121167]